MKKEKIINTLKDLKDYINENWDPYEAKKEIDDANDALEAALNIIESDTTNIVGTLELDGKTYTVIKN